MNQGQVIKYNILRVAEKNPEMLRRNGTVQMSKVALACGIKPQNFSEMMIKLESGGITVNTLAKIADGLGCDMVDLVQIKMFDGVKNENNTTNIATDKP